MRFELRTGLYLAAAAAATGELFSVKKLGGVCEKVLVFARSKVNKRMHSRPTSFINSCTSARQSLWNSPCVRVVPEGTREGAYLDPNLLVLIDTVHDRL
jgi:hypothetical protein